ncbi:MAG: magnesium transporter [Pirellulaceae bacterium]
MSQLTPDKALVACEHCLKQMAIKRDYLGRRFKCPACNKSTTAVELRDHDAPAQKPVARAKPKSGAHPVVKQNGETTASRSGAHKTVPPPNDAMIRCHFCHEYVPKDDFLAHRRQHLGTAADGQNNAYMTLPPEERYDGELDGVPQSYVHSKCGVETVMPEEIIRTYLVDPFFYANRSFCTGCHKHVRNSELTWRETKQNVNEYFKQLKEKYPHSDRKKLRVIWLVVQAGLIAALIFGLLVGVISYFIFGASTGLIAAGVTAIVLAVFVPLYLMWVRGGF